MISLLNGIIRFKKAPYLIIECAGIGYEVEATMSTFSNLPDLGESFTIYTHLSIREDAHILFGFVSLEERDLFRILIKVNGIGPKMGIVILSGISPEDLSIIISNEDSQSLTKLPGIGKKTAERLIVELKDKFKSLPSSLSKNKQDILKRNSFSEAVDALTSLGYKSIEAEKMVNVIDDPNLDSQTLIKKALQAKMKR